MADQVKRLPDGFRLGVKPTECGSRIRYTPILNSYYCDNKSYTFNEIIKTNDIINIIEYNMCFYACLSQFILQNSRSFQDFFPKIQTTFSEFKKQDPSIQKAILMLKMKKLFTIDLPFIQINTIDNNPCARGGMVDERVIYNAACCLRANIVILNSGQQIYKTTPTGEHGKVDICLLLNRSHYQLCEVPDDILNMNKLLNCNTSQEIEDKVAQIKREKVQGRTCKKQKRKDKFNWMKK